MKVKGGIIHKISNADLFANRDTNLYTDDEKKYIELLSVKNDSFVLPIGSFTYKIQKYPSDIDINQTVIIRNNNFGNILNSLKLIVSEIINSPLVYFADFKAGFDDRYEPWDREYYIIRWNPDEILKGFKVLPEGKIITLNEAIQMKGIIKLDIIAYTENRFIEASTFFILQKINPDGSSNYVNVPDDFFSLFVGDLKKEIKKYSSPETLKLFKAVKRMYSLARLRKDITTLKRLAPMIDSNLSLLGQINADIETMGLMLEKIYFNMLPFKELTKTLDSIGKRASTIIDIPLNIKFIANTLSQLKFQFNKLKDIPGFKGKSAILPDLIKLHDYFLNVINQQTGYYMKANKLLPINKEYLPSSVSGGRMHPKYYKLENYLYKNKSDPDYEETIEEETDKWNYYKKHLSKKEFHEWLMCIKDEGIINSNCDRGAVPGNYRKKDYRRFNSIYKKNFKDDLYGYKKYYYDERVGAYRFYN